MVVNTLNANVGVRPIWNYFQTHKLQADDLILVAESKESLHDKIVKWKHGMERKELDKSWKNQEIIYNFKAQLTGPWLTRPDYTDVGTKDNARVLRITIEDEHRENESNDWLYQKRQDTGERWMAF